MNWLLSLFRPAPRTKKYQIFWSTTKSIPGEPVFINGMECETGVVIITPHVATYEAVDAAQAYAMHRSDWPGTQPTSCITYE